MKIYVIASLENTEDFAIFTNLIEANKYLRTKSNDYMIFRKEDFEEKFGITINIE